jgi:Ca2+-binding EF-hand superfamily protein
MMMKRFALAGVALAALVAVPALALQQHAISINQPMTRAAVQAMIQTHFAQADVNGDGFVTKTEFDARIAAHKAQREAKRDERQADRFAALDTNKDGSISKAEFEAGHDARIEKRVIVRKDGKGGVDIDGDIDGDAKVKVMRRGGPGMGAGPGVMMMRMRMGENWFANADADKDGRVSLAEASAKPLAMFDRADTNKDGTITPEERRAVWDMMRAERPDKPGR